jgi:hypothetical protein
MPPRVQSLVPISDLEQQIGVSPGALGSHQHNQIHVPPWEITIQTDIKVGLLGNEGHKQEIIAPKTGLFVPGGRNTERRMIALRVQNPAARHEEASSLREGLGRCPQTPTDRLPQQPSASL